jgi:Flp pilus assembly protein TadG
LYIIYREVPLRGLDMEKSGKKNSSKSRHSMRNGVVCVWVVVVLLLLVTTVGLALDMGKVILVANQLQNAADAAALAGARIVKVSQDQARQNAINMALENYADGQSVQLASNPSNNPDGDIVVGRYDLKTHIFTPTTAAIANALKVVVRRSGGSLGGPVALNFGSLFNVSTCNMSRYAIAVATGGTGAGLIALAPDGIGLLLNGNPSLIVNDGAIVVDSAAYNAVRIIGNPEFDALELDVTGEVDVAGGFEFDPNFPVETGVPPSPDPLCPDPPGDCLPEPEWDSDYDLSPSPGQALKITGGTRELQPGYYSGGLRISGGNITFKPGIYILDGRSTGQKAGLVVGGNANICAKGVMFYIVGNGVVDLAGTGSIVVTPIRYDSNDFCDSSYSYPAGIDYVYEELGIFQSRSNTNDARIVGTSLLNLDGTLYFPSNHVDLSGTGDGFGDQLIARTVEISGTADMTIMYDGRNRSPANKSYLVE